MTDTETIKRIVLFADIKPGETILEIGAGTGFLTDELLKVSSKVIAIERDKNLAGILRKRLKDKQGLDVIEGNALKILDTLKFDKIVSNIPYSIAEALIMKLLEKEFERAVLTVPKSFAYKLIAKLGDKNFSRLSLMAEEFFSIEILMDVPKNAFEPRPKTNSVVIVIEPKKNKSLLRSVIRRRKMKVKNALREGLCETFGITKREARKLINMLKINNVILEKRVLNLSTEELKSVAQKVKNFSFTPSKT